MRTTMRKLISSIPIVDMNGKDLHILLLLIQLNQHIEREDEEIARQYAATRIPIWIIGLN